MDGLGKIFIIAGIILVVVGVFFITGHRIPFFGRLPGDIRIEREGFSFYFPLATSIIISVILTIIFSIFRK